MNLSEAIRLGAMCKPQKHGGPNNLLKFETHTCALSAAAEAAGMKQLSTYEPLWPWPWSNNLDMTCPACPWPKEKGRTVACRITVTHVVAHLNDKHRWTREQIADWVQTIEPPAPARELESATPVNAVDPCEGSDHQLPARV